MTLAVRAWRTVALVAALVLAGCAGGLRSDAPAVQTYFLRVVPPRAAPAPTPAAGSLQVARPLPAPGLAGDAIVVVQPDRRIDAYAASRWAGSLPDLVESLAVETFRSRGEIATVVDSRSAFPAEWLLQVRIRRFDAQYTSAGGAPRVVVALDCTLGRRVDRDIVATFAAEGSAQASDNRLGAVVAAFEQAANEALAAMAARSAETVRTSTAPLPP
jgi:cholesterol transport system auxiliary component